MKVKITPLIDARVHRDLLRYIAYRRTAGVTQSSVVEQALRKHLTVALAVAEIQRWPKEPRAYRPRGRPRAK